MDLVGPRRRKGHEAQIRVHPDARRSVRPEMKVGAADLDEVGQHGRQIEHPRRFGRRSPRPQTGDAFPWPNGGRSDSPIPRNRGATFFGRKGLSYSQTRAIARVATPETEEQLVELAGVMTAAQLETVTRAYRRPSAAARHGAEERDRRRNLSWHWDDDGNLVGRFCLPAEQGAALINAITAQVEHTAVQAADAEQAPDPLAAVQADALVDLISCGAAVSDGEVLDVGRRTRRPNRRLRTALQRRDGHCKYPGCTRRRTQAHHIRHWTKGGATLRAGMAVVSTCPPSSTGSSTRTGFSNPISPPERSATPRSAAM